MLDAFADMTSGLACPDDIGEIGGGVVEGIHLQAFIMGAGDEGVTGSEASAEHAKLFIALRFEPIETATNIDDSLASGREGASNVSGDGIISALEFAWLADVVIRLAQAQCRDAEPVKDLAKCIVAEGVGIPLRHDDHRTAVRVLGGEPARID